jgi:hypothetical protein
LPLFKILPKPRTFPLIPEEIPTHQSNVVISKLRFQVAFLSILITISCKN